MKNLVKWSLFLVLFSGFSLISCEETIVEDVIDNEEHVSQEVIDGLKYMREEEKLARDVYLYMYDKYDQNIFNNIASSEQSHMDKLLVLLDKYNIVDPSLQERGKFSNLKLQDLYDALIRQGEQSLIDAYMVGATIEDVDIFDLKEFVEIVQQEDIINTYELLTCGSRNHMRSFDKQINKNQAQYTAQFISQNQYDEIVNSSNEKCGR